MSLSIFQHYAVIITQSISKFRKVLWGVTSYHILDDHLINKDFFKSDEVNQKVIDTLYSHIDHALFELQTIHQIISLDQELNITQIHYLSLIIQWYESKLQILYHAIILEAHKSGMPITAQDVIIHEQALCDLETKIYGPKISDIYQEVHLLLDHMRWLVTQYQTSTHQYQIDQEDYQFFVQQLQWWSDDYAHHYTSDKHNTLQIEKDFLTVIQIAQIFAIVIQQFGWQTIIISYQWSQINYDAAWWILEIPIWCKTKELVAYLRANSLQWYYRIIIDPHSNSISTSLKSIKIPARYHTISIKRVCELINHEIMTHLVRSYNHKKTLIIKPSNISEAEEGLAVLNEKLVTSHIDQLSESIIDIHMIGTYLWEKLNDHEIYRYLSVYYLLNGEDKKKSQSLSKQRIARIKRFHSLTQHYSNRKDVWYSRWYQDTLQYFQQHTNNIHSIVQDLYDAKLKIQELDLGKELFVGCNHYQTWLINPLPLGTLIYEAYLGHILDITAIHRDPRYLITGWGYVDVNTLEVVNHIVTLIRSYIDTHDTSNQLIKK